MKPKILMLRTDWSVNQYRADNDTYGGIGYYRIVKPAEVLKDYYDIDIIGKHFQELAPTHEKRMEYIFNKYDLIFTRQINSVQLNSDLIACAKYFKKPIIMDMDDNFIDIKSDNPAYKEYEPGSQRVVFLSTALSLVDAITVSTEPLVEKYGRLNKNIHLIPNFNDINDWPLRAYKLANRKVIGYAGSITHDSDIVSVIEPLKEIFRRFPKVDFEVLGAVGQVGPFKEAFGEFRDRVHAYGGSPAWDGYNKVLSEMYWDIAIAPLEDDDFTRCKSWIKSLEYAMLHWPVVASNVYPYSHDVLGLKNIQHGKTGLLCKNSKEWIDNLSLLLENPELGKELSDNAHKYISENLQWSQHTDIYRKVFDSLLNK